MNEKSLTRFAWLSIFAALTTILLKSGAYLMTGSVGLLSDALESVVNLAGAMMALFMLRLAEKPPDDEHPYGHTKAEYFSSIFEGGLILIAALGIGITAVERLLHPRVIEQAFFGLAISAIASLINFGVSIILLKVGKKKNSITLEADGRHLMTDVWTSIGVIGGVAIVAITNIQILDPIIALLVALNIVVMGSKIVKQSILGLIDTSIPRLETEKIKNILDKYCINGVSYHGLKSRISATRRFVTVHILVPGKWSVQKSHDLLEKIEFDICGSFSKMTIITHLEPIEDPKSKDDISIDRDFSGVKK